jgi:SPP1 gp7 family putative phage head morphogenesis protein
VQQNIKIMSEKEYNNKLSDIIDKYSKLFVIDGYKEKVIPELIELEKELFINNINSSISKTTQDSLKANLNEFVVAKNYTLVNELNNVSTSIEISEKKALIENIFNKYSKTYTDVERRYIKFSSVECKQFQRYEGRKIKFKFSSSKDIHTTALCKSLNGIIKYNTDKFWINHTPPLHYGCRSTILIVIDEDILETPDDSIPEIEIDKTLSNPYFTGKFFSDEHNYFINSGYKNYL